MHVTIFEPGPQGRAIVARLDLPAHELATQLPHRALAAKSHGSLASFASYRPHATRGKDGVESLHAIVLDFDGLYPGDLEFVEAHLRALQVSAWIYTAWSHRDVHKRVGEHQGPFDSFRAVLPLSRPASPAEWEQIYPHVVQAVLPPWWGERYPRGGKRGLDPASERYAQGWYLPSCPVELADQARNVTLEGADLDVDHYLRLAATTLKGETTRADSDRPIDRVHRALATRGIATHERVPGQFSACCPAHAETNPSFGYTETDDGSVLLHCFAGCSAAAITSALGLSLRDLFPVDSRPEIEESLDEHDVNDAAIAALAADPDLYQRQGRLVVVGVDESDPGAGPRIRPLEQDGVRERLTRVARFLRVTINKDGEEVRVRVRPPQWCVGAVTRRGQWDGIRPLAGLIHCPTVRPDGSLLTEPGYDPATRLLLCGGLPVSVPAEPTPEHAAYARDALLGLVSDFPFEADTDRAVWLALLLTRVARRAVEGIAPLFCVTATAPGSGKTLLATLANLIVTGRPPSFETYSADPEEQRKLLHAAALEARECVFFDNATHLAGGPLDMAITSGRVGGRVLGRSETASGVLHPTWIVTGNNLTLGGDLRRRSLWCRLAPTCANPERRTGFRIPELGEHVLTHRGFYLSAALTLLGAYHRAGRPAPSGVFGSFELWSRWIAGAVQWVGLPNPVASQWEAAEEGDPEHLLHVALVRVVAEKGPLYARQLLSPEIYGLYADAVEAVLEGRGPDGRPSPKQLGKLLAGYRGRVVRLDGRDVALRGHTDRNDILRWYVA